MNQLSLTTYTLLLSVLVAVAQAQSFDFGYTGLYTGLYDENYQSYVADLGKGVKNAAIGM